MMRDALTEEEKQLAIKTIREENAETSMLSGTRRERYFKYMTPLVVSTDVCYYTHNTRACIVI